MIIKNEELKKITQDIDKIVQTAVKEQKRVNDIIDKFKKDDEDRMKAVDVLKAKRWNIIKDNNFGLKEFDVITNLVIKAGKLEATVENLFESWKKEFNNQKETQNKQAEEVLHPAKVSKTTTKSIKK